MATHCLQCKQKIPFFRRLTGEDFCSAAHAELSKKAMEDALNTRLKKPEPREMPSLAMESSVESSHLSEEQLLTADSLARLDFAHRDIQPFLSQQSPDLMRQRVRMVKEAALPLDSSTLEQRVPSVSSKTIWETEEETSSAGK
jgi:hypothetical protein